MPGFSTVTWRPMRAVCWRAGASISNACCAQRHFLDVDADSLYALGERLFNQTLDELRSVTRALRGDEDIGALRHQIPFAAYVEPTPGDPAQHGLYYVTPPADDAARAEHNACNANWASRRHRRVGRSPGTVKPPPCPWAMPPAGR